MKIELTYSVYDARKNKSASIFQFELIFQRMEEKKEEKAEVDLSPKDMLAVFLSAALVSSVQEFSYKQDGGRKGMTSEIAKIVVENTLKAFRERLQQKEKLIQVFEVE